MSNHAERHTGMRRIALLALAGLFCLVSGAFAYNVKLKDGSIIFARAKYTVKGKKAIITLENGTVTQIDLETVDVPGTDEYNKENPGNVIALDQGKSSNVPIVSPVPTTSLQEVIRQRKMQIRSLFKTPAPEAVGTPGATWQPVDSVVETAFAKILDGAQIRQYRLTEYRGKVRLLATANSEEAVFNTLSAAARAMADLTNAGREISIEIVITTSSGESGGTYEMTPEQARQLVNGNITVADYFLRNVNL
jgi:hypothetical protein